MRWLAALGVILLAFGVFVFLEVRGSTAADAGPDATPRTSQPTAAPSANHQPTAEAPAPTTEPKRKTLAAIVENIRVNANAAASGTAPSLAAPSTAEAGSAERAPDADDYLPYPDGSEPSSLRVKLRGANRRMNNGNYKGALEAANSLIDMYPDLWEAYGIATPALCAMGEQDKAATYLGRVTDEPTRVQIIEGCAGFGVKLGP